MDAQRFDGLARGLAAGTTRRGFFRLAAIALGAAVGGSRVVARAQQEACDDATPCAEGYECVEGICLGLNGSDCASDEDCVDGLICNDAMACEPIPVPCSSDADCTTGICCGGFCVDIECCIEDEDPNARCGENEFCYEGYCDFTCGGDDNLCGEGECCCPDGTCSADCCESLPDTGIGSTKDLTAILVGGLAVAAGAALAGREVRPTEQPVRKD